MAYLALIRHGESEWNAQDKWTGWTDIPLSEKGREQSRIAGEMLKGKNWDFIFESDMLRAKQTTDIILGILHNSHITRIVSPALKERNYGVYTGKNKLEIEKELGEEEYVKLRRGWNRPIPEGESLKQVYERVVPYFETEILPKLKEGKNVIISAHGNSLRTLVKYLDNISDEDVIKIEIPTGEVIIRQV